MKSILQVSLFVFSITLYASIPAHSRSGYQYVTASEPACAGGVFAAPANGNVGWLYKDPIAHTGIPDTDGIAPDNSVPPDWDYTAEQPVESHTGIDIAGKIDDPIFAAYDGVVSRDETSKVVIWHGDYGIDVDTYYTHLRNVQVKKGKPVVRGQLIGYMAPYGGFPHLHFSVKERDKDESHLPNTFDPSRYFNSILNYQDNTERHEKPITGWCREEAPHISIALIIDSSGSMALNDANNLRKSAAKYFISLSRPGDKITIVDFDSGVRTWAALTQIGKDTESMDKKTLQDAVEKIDSSGGTNIGLGLGEGYDNLLEDTSQNIKAAIFLTDGKDDPSGTYRNQHELYRSKGWSIYPIGLGSDIDDNLLQIIAESTGGVDPQTNGFYTAPTNDVLQVIYRGLASKLRNQISIDARKLYILPNQTINIVANVPEFSTSITFSTSWPGSDVNMSLITPNGINLDTNYIGPNMYHAKGLTFEVYRISVPTPGAWQVSITGTDVSSSGEPVDFNIEADPSPGNHIYLPNVSQDILVTAANPVIPQGTLFFTADDLILSGGSYELGFMLFAGEPVQWNAGVFTSDCDIGGLPDGFSTQSSTEYFASTIVYIPSSASRRTCSINGTVTAVGTFYPEKSINLTLQFEVLSPQIFATISIPIDADNQDGYEDPTFHISGDANKNDWVGLETQTMAGWVFSNIHIPRGATITNAYVLFRGFGNNGNAVARIHAFAEDNSAPFMVDGTNKPSTRPITSAYVDWPNTWPFAWSWFETPNIAPIIQEVINRPSWQSGNSLGLRISNPTGTGTNWSFVDRAAPTYDGINESGHSITLYITYSYHL